MSQSDNSVQMTKEVSSKYYEKYLKYKQKYLALKTQYGGTNATKCRKDYGIWTGDNTRILNGKQRVSVEYGTCCKSYD